MVIYVRYGVPRGPPHPHVFNGRSLRVLSDIFANLGLLQESTYIQFWAGDFGMERCAIKLMIPSSAEEDVLLSSPDTALQIWHIDVPPHGLGFHHLSWKNRPERGSLLTSWILQHNSTIESEEYRCPSGSFQAFELSCVGRGCRVDFRQSPKKKGLGGYLTLKFLRLLANIIVIRILARATPIHLIALELLVTHSDCTLPR